MRNSKKMSSFDESTCFTLKWVVQNEGQRMTTLEQAMTIAVLLENKAVSIGHMQNFMLIIMVHSIFQDSLWEPSYDGFTGFLRVFFFSDKDFDDQCFFFHKGNSEFHAASNGIFHESRFMLSVEKLMLCWLFLVMLS